MVGSSVLHQCKLLIPTHGNSPEIDSSSKREQECIFLLKKCTSVEELKQVHAQILKLGLFCKSFCASNLVATCALSEWGSMDYACSIFQHIDDPDSFDFNTMIRGHIKHMNLERALFTYLEMLDSGIEPDKFTYPAVLKACARLSAVGQGALDLAMCTHGYLLRNLSGLNVIVGTSLIDLYMKCGFVDRDLFFLPLPFHSSDAFLPDHLGEVVYELPDVGKSAAQGSGFGSIESV
ncbi:unnamed protein product [Fraxinus pennsylvanica]|uniref:Pentatricopeptide repeat-containing protein n=1 Tax=Fraxinus pennsylvanica TaxID=56036 RepID=A0AAD1ZLI5_9LAMI|nr:unnamed protein product [Fraxinus pennsylvanica]